MLSRVADSLYWMSRYLERAEHTCRLLDVNMSLMLEESPASTTRRWQRMVRALGNPSGYSPTNVPADFSDTTTPSGAAKESYQLAHALTFDAESRSSVTACIMSARENARQVREQITSEQWQRLNRLFHHVTQFDLHANAHLELSEFLQSVMEGVHLFQGVTDSTMSHGEGWQFIQLGRYLERASATVTLLNVYPRDFWSLAERAPEENEYLEWIGLLRSCTAFEAYCRAYSADVFPDRILGFLLLNEEFPHSVRYSIDCVQRALEAIHGESGKPRAMQLTRMAGRLQALLSFGDVSEIIAQDVCVCLREIQQQCHQIHAGVYELYIHYAIQTALAG